MGAETDSQDRFLHCEALLDAFDLGREKWVIVGIVDANGSAEDYEQVTIQRLGKGEFRRRNLDRFDGKTSTDEFVLQAAEILEREVREDKGR